jgi:hypothetical protein
MPSATVFTPKLRDRPDHSLNDLGAFWAFMNRAHDRASGFSVVGRPPTDVQGRPYPLLHMREGDGS